MKDIITTTITMTQPMTMRDISGIENIHERIEESPTKRWIKSIPMDKSIPFQDYNRNGYFSLVAEIVLDNILSTSGVKQRNTMIQFVPSIPKSVFEKNCEWLYLFTINGMIVKIGGTRNGLKQRCGSYLCGHHTTDRGNSGSCSNTNAFIYNTFEFYLKLGCKVEMYGYQLPNTEITIDIFGEQQRITAQTYHAYESTFLEDYKKNYDAYPFLSDNCDPNYKKPKPAKEPKSAKKAEKAETSK